jgi:dUTP pyrophosphatase
MDYNIDEIRDKLFQAMDPNNEYTMEEFNDEYNNVSHTASVSDMDIFKFPIKFVNKSNNQDPSYASDGAAGFDFRANLDETLILNPGKHAMIPTGLYFELPPNLEMQVRPRSGLAAKHAVTVLNSPGTIDSDYRGEVKIILINHSGVPFIINNGDRIAQGVIATVTAEQMVKFNKVDELNNNTERGIGGFGSTGIK